MPVSIIGHASANTTTVSLPAGTQAGDFAIVTAGRTNTGGPSVPDASWTDNGVVSAGSGGTAHGQRSGWKRLTPADITAGNVGTWTNATEIQVLVLRGSVASITDVSGTGTNGTTMSLPARTIAAGSLVIGMGTHRSQTGTTLTDATVTDYTTRSTGTTSARVWCGTGTASASLRSITGLASSGNVGLTLEVDESIQPPIQTGDQAVATAPTRAHVGFVVASALVLLSATAADTTASPTISWTTQQIVTAARTRLPQSWTQNGRMDVVAATLPVGQASTERPPQRPITWRAPQTVSQGAEGVAPPPSSAIPDGKSSYDLPRPKPFPHGLRTHIFYFVFDAVEPSEPFKSVAQPLPDPRRSVKQVGFTQARPLVFDAVVAASPFLGSAQPLPAPRRLPVVGFTQSRPLVFDPVAASPFVGAAQPLPSPKRVLPVGSVAGMPRALETFIETPLRGTSTTLPTVRQRHQQAQLTLSLLTSTLYVAPPSPIFGNTTDLPRRAVPPRVGSVHAKPQYYVDAVTTATVLDLIGRYEPTIALFGTNQPVCEAVGGFVPTIDLRGRVED